MLHFLKGLVIGFCIAAPVGPVGLLCLRRTLTDGRLAGFVSGLGAATADALYGLLAALGVSALLALLDAHNTTLELFGGAFLIAIGIWTWRVPPPRPELGPAHAPTLRMAYASTLALTLANPISIVAFTGVLAAAGLGGVDDTVADKIGLIVGVFLGSCAWWTLLTLAAGWFRRHLEPRTLRLINHVAGAAIVLFGVGQLAFGAAHLLAR